MPAAQAGPQVVVAAPAEEDVAPALSEEHVGTGGPDQGVVPITPENGCHSEPPPRPGRLPGREVDVYGTAGQSVVECVVARSGDRAGHRPAGQGEAVAL